MTAQASVPPDPPAVHRNAGLIERLYTAIQNADLTAIDTCYDDHAYFQDIAFRRNGKKEIMEMWRYVCHGKPQVTFDPNAISADNQKGGGRWRVKYVFGKTDTKPGRPVDNAISSAFTFRDSLIVEHRDSCDAMAWARQGFALSLQRRCGLRCSAAAVHGRSEALQIQQRSEAVNAASVSRTNSGSCDRWPTKPSRGRAMAALISSCGFSASGVIRSVLLTDMHQGHERRCA